MDAITVPPAPRNEAVVGYGPATPERASLQERLKTMGEETAEITLTIGGGTRMAGGAPFDIVQPHRHASVIGRGAQATPRDVEHAIGAALAAGPGWRSLPFDER